jgi:hypothetical protein
VYLNLLCFVLFALCFLYCFVYVYLFLFGLSVLVSRLQPPSDNSIAVHNNNNNNNKLCLLRGHCATSREVAGSIPDGVIGNMY